MEIQNLEKPIKISLAILLLLCLFPMPYGYYQLVRFLALVGFAILAYINQKNQTLLIVYMVLAVLFQPFFKISLGRFLWNLIDFVVAIGLIISVWISPKIKN